MSEIRLKSVRLKNFKKHADREIHFSETLTVICGPNYSGKSSILEGIFFALFGTRAVPGGAANVQRRNSDSKATVELDITVGEENYRIQRTPNSAALYRMDGPESAPVAAGHTAVTDWLLTKIGTGNMKRALALAFSSQGETQAILQMGAPALNALIEELTGVKYVDQLIELAVKKADVAERKLETLGDNLQDPAELQTIIDDTSLAVEAKELEVAKLDPEIEKLRKEVTQIKSDLDTARQSNEKAEARALKIIELKTRVEGCQSTYDAMKADLAKMQPPDTSDLETLLKDAVTEMERLDAEAEAYETEHHEHDKHEAWLDQNEDKLSDQSVNLAMHRQASSELVNAEKEMRDAAEKFTTAKLAHSEAEAAQKNAVCGACQRPFDQKHLDAIQAKLPSLTRKRDETCAEFEKCEAKVTELRKEIARLSRVLPPEDWAEQIGTRRTLLAASKNRLEKLPVPNAEVMEKAREEVAELRNKKRMRLTMNRLYGEATQRVERAETALTKAKNELESTEPLAKVAVEGLIERHVAAVTALSERSAVRSAAAAETDRLKSDLNALKTSLQKAQKHWQDRLDAESVKTRYTKFARWLRENKAAFLADTWAGLLALVSQFSSEVTSGYIEEVGRDPDGDFWYREEGYVCDISASSGGQKSIVGVGLRLALPSLLPASLGFIALDEASSDLNEVHSAALAGALRTSERQVILVTHREGEQFSSDSVVVLE
jgi:exonuclease SbcC